MPTTYTDIFYDRVLTSLEKLWETEFEGVIHIYVSDQYEEQEGTEALRLEYAGSEQITVNSNSETRRYRIGGSYYIRSKASRKRIETMSNRIARLNRIVLNNQHEIVSSVYQWHDAKIPIWEQGIPEEGEPADIGIMRFTFECTTTENIS